MSKEEEQKGVVEYQSMTGEKLQLSKSIIKEYLVSGDADKISDQEIMMFMSLCKFQKLNPFLKEAYCIKYGTSPATIVVGKETFLKRAAKNSKYKGHKTGASDETPPKTAWAEVFVEGYDNPIRCEVDYDEYVGKKRDGTVNSMWASKPKTMLKKVALVQALREAFPEDFGGMYSEEEIEPGSAFDPKEIIEKSQVQRKSDQTASASSSKSSTTDDGKKKATTSQIKLIHVKLKDAEVTEQAFKGYMGIESMKELPFEYVNGALAAIEEGKIPKEVAQTPDEEFGEEKEF